jgi:hypothetical protein
MRILIVLIIVILFYNFQRSIYSTKCFKDVFIEIKFALNGIFEGENIELNEVIFNKKIIPLWWVTSHFQVSRNLIFDEERNENKGNDNYRRNFFSIMPYERVTKTFSIIGGKRGYYTIGQIDLHSGDLFGLSRIIASYQQKAELYVYPRLIIPQDLNVNFRSLTGEILTKRNIVEDPFQLRGIREYSPYDGIKTINWNATAKTGELKVNQFDFTASQEVIVFLNVERYNAWDPEKLIEESISLAASLISQYLKLGMKVGLKSNGCDLITGEQIKLPSVFGINQDLHFYQSLARLETAEVSTSLSSILKEEQIKLNKVPIWVVISHYYGVDLKEQVAFSRKLGFDVKWILPKVTNIKVDMEDHRDLYIWEVKEV